jgi:hypothetical protein
MRQEEIMDSGTLMSRRKLFISQQELLLREEVALDLPRWHNHAARVLKMSGAFGVVRVSNQHDD